LVRGAGRDLLWPRQLAWQPMAQHSEQQAEWSRGVSGAWCRKPEMRLRSIWGLVFSACCLPRVWVDPCVLCGLSFNGASW